MDTSRRTSGGGCREGGGDGSGLVRVTVVSSTRRVDVALPGLVPVAELVPELARWVGLLDVASVHRGLRLVTGEGRALDGDSGVAAQGVRDGAVLTLAADLDDRAPRVHDDVAEAMGDVVSGDLQPWDASAGRWTASAAALLLLLVGAGGLVLVGGSARIAVGAALVAVVLVVGAGVVSRRPGHGVGSVVVAWAGCCYAALAGLVVGGGPPLLGTPVAAAGGGALVAGVVAALVLAEGRALLLPPVVAGVVLLVTGLVTRTSSYDPAVVLTATLSVVVSAGSVFPWLALGATGTTVGRHVAGFTDAPVDVDRLRGEARLAHRILVALSATVGLLLVVVAPVAVSLGPAGVLVAVLACGVVMLRTRHHLSGVEVLAGLASGIVGVVSTALSVLWLLPSWRSATSGALAVVGVLLLAPALSPGRAPSPQTTPSRLRRLAGPAETLALLALPPSLVVATGVLGWVVG